MMIQGQAAGHPGRQSRPRVAVIGAGVAGLTAAYLLQRAYDVTLYEAQDRLGGHAHTHDIAAARAVCWLWTAGSWCTTLARTPT
jgi:predicted NAD/FAD-binding protein